MTKESKKNLIIGCILLVLFAAFTFALMKVDVKPIGPEGSSVGLSLINKVFDNFFPFNEMWYKISKYLGYVALLVAGLFALRALAQFIAYKGFKKMENGLFALMVLYFVTLAIYVVCTKYSINYRPVIIDALEGLEYSYPSSHTLLEVVVYMSGVKQLDFTKFKNEKFRALIKAVFIILMAFSIITRLLAGVHWFTDILGSVILGKALVRLYQVFLYK